MEQIFLEGLMSKEVKCVSPETTLEEVVCIMAENKFSCVVVAEESIPVGIITERDMVRVLGNKLRNESLSTPEAAKFMSSPVTTINESETLLEAIATTHVRKVRHLPVVNNAGRISGLVTLSDLVGAYFHIIEAQHAEIQRSVERRTQELQKINKQLKVLSLEDPLLCIGNRRAMELDLEHTHSGASRYHRPYSVALLDLDYFKQYNDYYGHPAGDEILKQLIDYIKRSIRKSDRLYRYGGEEFLLILPETELGNAASFINRLIKGLYLLGIPHKKSPFKIITMTGGIGYVDVKEIGNTSWENVVDHADHGLYQAKNNGRNQAVAESPENGNP